MPNRPVELSTPSSCLPHTVEADRTSMLAAVGRTTLFVLGALPVLTLLGLALWPFPLALWTLFLFVGLGIIAAGLIAIVIAEIWRRVGLIVELTALNEQLRYRATHDRLMGIPNRELLQAELAQAVAQSQGAEHGVGLLFLDLDRFKFVNDTFGHTAGDELLQAVGVRIESVLKGEDAIVARVGGDELVVLMRTLTSPREVHAVAHRLLRKFEEPFDVEGVGLTVGTSIGMAVSIDGEDADDLYRHADAALYRAKRQGRGQAVMADTALRAKRNSRLRTELALRGALANHEIEAWYQPEVNLVTGEIVAAEALARWRTDDGIEIAGSFVEVARRGGLLEQLMVEMSAQVWQWQEKSPHNVPIALNVSVAHLPQLLAMHDQDRGRRPFSGLRLEIAETDIIRDFQWTRALLNRARELGAQVMLDDFGSGFSSVQMLTDLPIDGIKLDRSYVVRLQTDSLVRNLVTRLVEFGRDCGLLIVAEGVETAEQAEYLSQVGIDRGQGFLFSKAVDEVEFGELLERGYTHTALAGRF